MSCQRLQLGKELRNDAELQRQCQANRWPWREEELFDLTPDAFGRQIVQRNGGADCARGIVQREPEARTELQRSENPQAVVRKSRRVDDAQKPPRDVAPAVERIEIFVGERIPRDGVDREVAPPRGFLDGHRRIAGDVETLVPASRF